jgi:2-C-methyl-D-erythritol 4-phosphate cytidylyltransferase
MKICAIFPAAGKSSRFENTEKKQFAELEGRAVWLRTIELFCNRADVCQLILVINPEDRELVIRRFAANLAFLGVQLIDGGLERCDSVQNALERVSPEATHVAIHDAVRPCVETKQIDAVFKAAEKHGAAILATRLVHTLKKEKESADGVIEKTLPRKQLWLAQTPQVFRADWIKDSYRNLDKSLLPTDDAEVMEEAGHPVHLVECGLTNLKITTATDLLLAENILKSRPKAVERKFHPFYED